MTVCTRLSLGQFIGKKMKQRTADIYWRLISVPRARVVLVESPAHLQKLIAPDSGLNIDNA